MREVLLCLFPSLLTQWMDSSGYRFVNLTLGRYVERNYDIFRDFTVAPLVVKTILSSTQSLGFDKFELEKGVEQKN